MLDLGARRAHRIVDVCAPTRLGVVDLTDELETTVRGAEVREGCVLAFCAHTTATLILNELEDGALEDLRRRLEALVPGDGYYAHDDLERRRQNLQEGHERPNGRSHVTQIVLGGSSQVIPVLDGAPALGRWQRLLLLELDEPRQRRVIFTVLGQGTRD
jgi:secondary thiamine-phosphate synthase enzyme